MDVIFFCLSSVLTTPPLAIVRRDLGPEGGIPSTVLFIVEDPGTASCAF